MMEHAPWLYEEMLNSDCKERVWFYKRLLSARAPSRPCDLAL